MKTCAVTDKVLHFALEDNLDFHFKSPVTAPNSANNLTLYLKNNISFTPTSLIISVKTGRSVIRTGHAVAINQDYNYAVRRSSGGGRNRFITTL